MEKNDLIIVINIKILSLKFFPKQHSASLITLKLLLFVCDFIYVVISNKKNPTTTKNKKEFKTLTPSGSFAPNTFLFIVCLPVLFTFVLFLFSYG